MSPYRDVAYRLDPVLWVREVVGVIPTAWQETFLRAPRGAFIMALTARQVGKTTTRPGRLPTLWSFIPARYPSLPVRHSARARKGCGGSAKRYLRPTRNSKATTSMPLNWKTALAFWRCRPMTRIFVV